LTVLRAPLRSPASTTSTPSAKAAFFGELNLWCDVVSKTLRPVIAPVLWGV
jgi:hypothetical protein